MNICLERVKLHDVLGGGWGPWSDWTQCGITCGNSFIQRTRICNRPDNSCQPADGNLEREPCFREPCPVG